MTGVDWLLLSTEVAITRPEAFEIEGVSAKMPAVSTEGSITTVWRLLTAMPDGELHPISNAAGNANATRPRRIFTAHDFLA